MSVQSLAESLVPLASASATQPRSTLQSPFSPLVGWLATWLSSEDRAAAARTDRFLVTADPDLFISPVAFPKPSNTPPTAYSTDSPGIASRDDDVSEKRVPFGLSHKQGLTKDEFDCVVNSLLEYLEEAELASPELECERYEHYAPENTQRKLRHGLWSPGSPLYPVHDNDNDDDDDDDPLSDAETLEMDEAYNRKSLELVRTACTVPLHAELPAGGVKYPYRFEFEFEGVGSDSE